jgi:hypothetical protein
LGRRGVVWDREGEEGMRVIQRKGKGGRKGKGRKGREGKGREGGRRRLSGAYNCNKTAIKLKHKTTTNRRQP